MIGQQRPPLASVHNNNEISLTIFSFTPHNVTVNHNISEFKQPYRLQGIDGPCDQLIMINGSCDLFTTVFSYLYDDHMRC